MMKFCPKCRSFYEDADLRFCLRDGVPLVAVGESEKLRGEGEDFIDRSERRIRRETFRKQIRKIVSITITTILTILVISVWAINSWLYLNPEPETETKTETIQPEPQPFVETPAEPVPSNTESPPALTEAPTPNPTPSPTNEIETPTPEKTPAATPTPVETVTPTATPTRAPTPKPGTPVTIPVSRVTPPTIQTTPVCSQDEKRRAISFIKNRYAAVWREEILRQKEPLQNEIASANNISARQISVELNYSPERISVSISSDCRRADVGIQILWTVRPNAPNIKIRKLPPRRRNLLPYKCEKAGSTWNCN